MHSKLALAVGVVSIVCLSPQDTPVSASIRCREVKGTLAEAWNGSTGLAGVIRKGQS